MLRWVIKWLDRLFRLEIAAAALLALFIGLFVFVSAAMRYLLGTPLDFSDELVALLFVTSAFLSLPYATRQGINIRLDILVRRLPEPRRKNLLVVTRIATILIFAAFSIAAIEEIALAIEIEEVTDVAEVPVYPFKLVVLFSAFSTILAFACNIFAGTLASENEGNAIREEE